MGSEMESITSAGQLLVLMGYQLWYSWEESKGLVGEAGTLSTQI